MAGGSDWRCETYYLASCSAYLDHVNTDNLLPSYARLPDDHRDGLRRLPDGRN